MASTVTFEEMDREHRRERARDAERVRSGEITAKELQEENSFLGENVRVEVVDFASALTRVYASR